MKARILTILLALLFIASYLVMSTFAVPEIANEPDGVRFLVDGTDTELPADGPWMVFWNRNQLWVAGKYCEGLRFLAENVWDLTISPTGGNIAYITGEDDEIHLHIRSLSTDNHTIIDTPTPIITRIDTADSYRFFSYDEGWNMAWSRDGQKLAFLAGESKAEADLFLFNAAQNTLTLVVDDENSYFQPIWSPDGGALIYHTWKPEELFSSIDEIWMYSLETGKSSMLLVFDQFDSSKIKGWWDESNLLMVPDNFWSAEKIEILNINKNRSNELIKIPNGTYYNNLFVSSEAKKMMFTYKSKFTDTLRADFWNLESGEQIWSGRISNEPFTYPEMSWSSEIQVMFIEAEPNLFAISAEGEQIIFDLSIGLPSISSEGAYWVFHENGNLRRGQLYGNLKRVFDGRVQTYAWIPGTEDLIFIENSIDKTIYYAKAPDFLPVPIATGFDSINTFEIEWVIP